MPDTTATYPCCWCDTQLNQTQANQLWNGHLICDACWAAGDDGFAPNCGEECRLDIDPDQYRRTA